MNSLKSKILACTVTSLLCLYLNMPGAWAETQTLTKDSKLHPQGWSVGDEIEFKKNTAVSLNDNGEVIAGTLANNTLLCPRGRERVINDYYFISAYTERGPFFSIRYRHFWGREYNIAIPGYGHLLYKKGTRVTFSEQGEVLKGMIASKATVRLRDDKYGFIVFKENSVLEFYPSGNILSGVLAADTYLRPVGWASLPASDDMTNNSVGFIRFSKDKQVMFNEQGELVSGTLKESAILWAGDGNAVEYPANTNVRFNNQGHVEQ